MVTVVGLMIRRPICEGFGLDTGGANPLRVVVDAARRRTARPVPATGSEPNGKLGRN